MNLLEGLESSPLRRFWSSSVVPGSPRLPTPWHFKLSEWPGGAILNQGSCWRCSTSALWKEGVGHARCVGQNDLSPQFQGSPSACWHGHRRHREHPNASWEPCPKGDISAFALWEQKGFWKGLTWGQSSTFWTKQKEDKLIIPQCDTDTV